MIEVTCLFGHIEMRRLPPILAVDGKYCWLPYELVDRDTDGRVRSRRIYLGMCITFPQGKQTTGWADCMMVCQIGERSA